MGDAGQTGPEAEVVVGRLLVEPDQTFCYLLRIAHQIPLPGQILWTDRPRLLLTPVRPPLCIAATLVCDRRCDYLPRPSRALVHMGHPRGNVWEVFLRPPVARQSLAHFLVYLRKGSPAY